jgi:large-conductance mechanosensitive channel
MKLSILIPILLLFNIGLSASPNPIDDQFKALNESSETFKEYKVIKITTINNFWKSVMDSIYVKEAMIASLKTENTSNKVKIDQLKANIGVKEASIEELQYATTHISLFGINFGKVFYQIINFIIIGVLLVFSFILIINLNERRSIAKIKIDDFAKLEIQFEEYKKDALDKQMKLRRELQTERNKLEQKKST